MRLKEAAISTLMLLAYTIGLAHNVIPHCHHDIAAVVTAHEQEAGSDHHEHHHEHHQHDGYEVADHEHVAHDDHFDDGLLDYIICTLNETEHPSGEDNHSHIAPVKTNQLPSNWLAKEKFATVLIAVFTAPSEHKAPLSFGPDVVAATLSPRISDSPHRGPPSIS